MFALTMNSTDQVPSHVRITVHQGREILLKNKNGSSELYVSVHVEKEKFVTSFVPKSTAPQWNHTTDVPLMSLDTTIHITVRQKGRISEDFIGYIAIPLRNFNINSKQITHWYKLGSKPGKIKHKLRGDLLISIQFLSKWTLSSTEQLDPPTPSSPVVVNKTRRGSMLRRSKSDVKLKSKDMSGSASLIDKPQSQSKVKERLAVFRRSFRKKNRSPVFQNCEDEFETFSQSASSTPNLRQRTHTFDSASSLRGKTGPSDSDATTNSDLSQSPPISIRPSVQALFAEAAALENGSAVSKEEEQQKTEKITSAVKFHSFRNKKTRWSMYNIPVTPVNTPQSRSDRILGGGGDPTSSSTTQTDGGPSKSEDPSSSTVQSSAPETLDTVTYRAKSSSIARSPRIVRSHDRPRSYSISDSQQSVRSTESTSEYGGSESAMPLYSPQMSRKVTATRNHSRSNTTGGGGGHESGYNTGSSQARLQVQQTSAGELSSTSNSEGTATKSEPNGSLPVNKTTPTKRVVTSPVASQSPRIRPRMLNYGPGPPRLERRATIAESIGRHQRSTSSPRRLLPATPVQRRERPLTSNRPVSSSDMGEQQKKGVTDSQRIFSHTPQDLNQVERVANGDALVLRNPNKEENEADSCESSSKIDERNGRLSTPTDEGSHSTSSLGSGDRKTKHTVKYKESSPLFKKGFQPVSLLPPSLSDYRAQTLPSRGKLLRRHSELSSHHRPLSGSLRSVDGESGGGGGGAGGTVPRIRPNRSPENIKLIHRHSMTFAVNGPQIVPTPHQPSQGGDAPTQLPNKIIESTNNGADTVKNTSPVTPVNSGVASASNSQPETPSGGRHNGKSPGEIVTGALRNRKPSSGLRKAINMYQENRRQLSNYKARKVSQESGNGLEFELSLDSADLDRQRLLRSESTKRPSVSAGNSPRQLRRNRSAAETFGHVFKNPFNSLRRTRSQYTTINSAQIPSNGMDEAPLTPSNLLKVRHTNSLINVNQPSFADQKTSAPALLAAVKRSVTSTAAKNTTSSSSLEYRRTWEDQVVHEGEENLSPTILVRSPTLTETSSVKTLTGADSCGRCMRESGSPNPASAVGGHTRHTTCGSVESEGFGSVTSEELSLEELAHIDWSHWTKEDLVKELILSKQRHRSTEEELHSIRNYLDNLLLRIMDTNPSLLNVSPTP